MGSFAGKEAPLQTLRVDRIELGRLGFSDDHIDSIYRTLYVTTLGFYASLNDHTKFLGDQGMGVKARIWMVFNCLMQTACESEFKNIVQTLIEQQQQRLEQAEKET